MLRVLVKVTLMAYLVGGCAYHGPSQSDIDNPEVRKVVSPADTMHNGVEGCALTTLAAA